MACYSLLIDVTKCTGCYNCFLTCRDEYYGNDYGSYSAAQPLDGQFWMQVKEIERGRYPKPKVDYIPLPCLHCRTAPCVDAAADEAVYRRADGIVLIDPKKAKGQRAIVDACPYRVVFWNSDAEIPQKCTMCAHRLDEGAREPRCVEACPTGALVFGDLDNPASEIARLSASLRTEAYHPEYATEPTVRHVGIPKRFIAGEVVRSDRRDECAEGVLITLEGGGQTFQTSSDSYGDFEFDGLERNVSYEVRIQHDGYRTQTFEVSTQTDVNLGEVLLEPSR